MRKLTIILFTLIISSLFLVNVSISDFPPDPEGEYSPWGDLNDDGAINIFDIVWLASRYGTAGTPQNVTELLLELETRVDVLNATITSLKECIVITGSKPYNAPTTYTSGTGFLINVSESIPSGFTLVSVFATGRKTDLGGTTLDEPPLNLLPRVSGTNIEIRVWDAGGTEYDDWSNQRAHIDYTLFFTKSTG